MLWRTLSIEEDLLQGVLLQLDPPTLANIELTCTDFRSFIQRTNTWRKMFEGFERGAQNLRNIVSDGSDSDHVLFKRMCLKIVNLEYNLNHGKCRKTKTELPTVFGNYNSGLFSHSLKAMHPGLVFVEGILRDLENSLVFDVKTGSRKCLTPPPFPDMDCRVRSVDISADQVCLIRTPSPEHPEETFCIVETYTVNAFNDGEFSLSSQSEPQEREDFGVGLKIKLSGEEKILVLTFNMFGAEPMHGRVNVLEIDPSHRPTGSHPQRLVVTQRIKCFSEDLFSKLSIFSEDHLVGCAGPEDQVEIWDLEKVRDGLAEKVWSKRIVCEVTIPRIRITSLESRPPILLVGKNNGRVEVWHTRKDRLLRTLECGIESGMRMAVTQVSVQERSIFCLTEAGWLFAWDWDSSTALSQAAVSPKWKIRPKNNSNPIMNFVSSPTEIVSLEGGPGRRFMYLVKRDFLNHVENGTGHRNKRAAVDDKNGSKNSSPTDLSKKPKLHSPPAIIELTEDSTDEEDVIFLDENNIDSEDVILLPDGNVIVLE